MFCDLVGSTALASRLDAEDWPALAKAYLDEASAGVTGLGGDVLKRLGDGLMALFGYPSAQENDAERAVPPPSPSSARSPELNVSNASKGSPELAARIGLNSGPVVIDATGEPSAKRPISPRAFRSRRSPGTVLVTAAVQRQVAAPKTYLSASPVATKATRRSCTAGCALKAGLR